ncbi:hypothetical protein Ciccas_010644, partial [Cichlidogyrus casuarinus]
TLTGADAFWQDVSTACAGWWDFLNGGLSRTRMRYLFFYFLFYGTNVTLIVIWYFNFQQTATWYYFPAVMVISISQVGGFILLQVYLVLFASSKRGTSICGICCYDSLDGGKAEASSRVAKSQSTSVHNGSVSQNVPSSASLRDSVFGINSGLQAAKPISGRRSANHSHAGSSSLHGPVAKYNAQRLSRQELSAIHEVDHSSLTAEDYHRPHRQK